MPVEVEGYKRQLQRGSKFGPQYPRTPEYFKQLAVAKVGANEYLYGLKDTGEVYCWSDAKRYWYPLDMTIIGFKRGTGAKSYSTGKEVRLVQIVTSSSETSPPNLIGLSDDGRTYRYYYNYMVGSVSGWYPLEKD